MRPEKGNSTGDVRWRSRRVAAAVLRILIFLVPLAVGFAAGRLVASWIPPTESAYDVAAWWVLVIAAATVSATLTDKLARRLLPLTLLLKMTMLFPDRAPSRMRVALRSGNFTELRKRIDRAQRGEETDVGEMAELILSLAAALSRHDRKTRGHSERTRAYTDIIADEMGLAEEDRDKLRWAALLHDVGKLEVPTEVLNKEGKLDDEEWHLIRQHPVFGMKLIAPLVPWLGPWAETVEHHHERYDGTGYPHGLAGSSISLGARIVSVGDAYDVMTSGRSYQHPKTPAAAREEIAKLAGQQFDPVVVRALMNVSLGRLRGATGPIAVLAELPFIRGLPNIGRDAATLLTSSAMMATTMAVGIIPSPASILPVDVAQVVEAAAEELTGPPPAQTPPASPEEAPSTSTTLSDTSTSTSTVPAAEEEEEEEEETTTTAATPPSTDTSVPPPPTSAPLTSPPVVRADTVTTAEDTAISIDVLANDIDPDGDLAPVSLSLTSEPFRGSAGVQEGRITYRPDRDFHGEDQLGYQVCDETDLCSGGIATIQVTPVNDAPVGLTDSASMKEDETLTLALEVFDADGDRLTCTLVGSPATGAATVPADCSRLVFAPSADYFGTLSIKVAVSDGEETTEFAISIDVSNVNDAPVAGDDGAETDWGTPIDIAVLGNDSDADGDRLSVAIGRRPTIGSATVVGSSIRYTPTFGIEGVQTFTYRVCDPSNACDTATVTVTVRGMTRVRPDRFEVTTATLSILQVAANDTPGSGRWFRPSFEILTPPGNGRARTLGWGRIAYTSARGFTGQDSLVYRICDTEGSCGQASVTIDVVSG